MISIVTTRFNSETWQENINFKKKNNFNGGIYSVPGPLSPKIQLDSLVFVVEMNNTLNKIEGIGLIHNNYKLDKYFKVYEAGNYNRYFYKGNYRIDREELIRYNETIVNSLEHIVFKGKTHLKRGSGFTTITEKLLEKSLCKEVDMKTEIKKIFKIHFTKTDDSFTKEDDPCIKEDDACNR